MTQTPAQLAARLINILVKDREESLERPGLLRLKEYHDGNQDDAFLPDDADDELVALHKRSKTNILKMVVDGPVQACYVEKFNRGDEFDVEAETSGGVTPEWQAFKRGRMMSRQTEVHRASLIGGQSFVVVEKDKKGRTIPRALSFLTTSALYVNPGSDEDPIAALHVTQWPNAVEGDKLGRAIMWDEVNAYAVTFKSTSGLRGKDVTVAQGVPHGADVCPVTRFTAFLDLDGNAVGLIEPLMPVQDRVNQTYFDMLCLQNYQVAQWRYVAGAEPPYKRDPETGELLLDEDGEPIPDEVKATAARFHWFEDPDAKIGSLPQASLDGILAALERGFKDIIALGHLPPYYLLGQVANLSADAITASERSFNRLCEELRTSWGDSWLRVMRICAQMEGSDAGDDYQTEVDWREMDGASEAVRADAISKYRSVGMPERALWRMIPGATARKLKEWEELAELEPQDPVTSLSEAVTRARTPRRTSTAQAATDAVSVRSSVFTDSRQAVSA